MEEPSDGKAARGVKMTYYEACSAAIDEDIDTLWRRLGNLYEEEETT